jgi:hypothetical protein
MSAYAFHVYSWTKALDTDLIVGGNFFLFLFLHHVWNLRMDVGEGGIYITRGVNTHMLGHVKNSETHPLNSY